MRLFHNLEFDQIFYYHRTKGMPSGLNGVTVGVGVREGKWVYATAIARKPDNFSRKIGRKIVEGRLKKAFVEGLIYPTLPYEGKARKPHFDRLVYTVVQNIIKGDGIVTGKQFCARFFY